MLRVMSLARCVVAVVTIALLAGQPAGAALATSPSGDSATDVLVTVPPDTNELVVTPLDGTAERRIDVGAAFDLSTRGVIGKYAVLTIDDGGVTVVDLATGSVQAVSMPDSMADLDLIRDRSWTTGTTALFGAPAGGGLGFIDLPTATAQPLGDPDSRYVPGPTDGTSMRFLDLTKTATLIVPLDNPASAFEVPGFATSSIVDGQLFSVIRDQAGPGTVQRIVNGEPDGQPVVPPSAVVGGFQGPTSAFAVLADGELVELDFENGVATSVGNVGFTPQSAAQIGSQRLFVVGESRSALLDSEGALVASFDAPVIDGETQRPYVSGFGTACAVVQDGPSPFLGAGERGGSSATSSATEPSGPRRTARLIDLADGAVLVSLDSSTSVVTADGCTALPQFGGGELVLDRQLVDSGFDSVFDVSPTGEWLLARDTATKTFVVLNLVTRAQLVLEPQLATFTRF